MKRSGVLAAIQLVLTLLQVYLISKISIIGKIGIALFYKEYAIFRSGWKTFLLFLGIQLIIIAVLEYLKRRNDPGRLKLVSLIIFIIACGGLFFTYYDFMFTYSHRLLKERFHLGFYLFWIGMMITCAVYFFSKPLLPRTEEQNETEGGSGNGDRALPGH